MKQKESKRFEILYDRHLKKLKLQGKSKATISAYSRAVRRITEHFGCCPDQLTIEQLEDYFTRLVENYSWSTVKLDRLGLMFFWKHVLLWGVMLLRLFVLRILDVRWQRQGLEL